jgi:hypothetical protein
MPTASTTTSTHWTEAICGPKSAFPMRNADVIAFNDPKKDVVAAFIKSEASGFIPALERVSKRIAGFESPFGMELLATVDWLMVREGRKADVADIEAGSTTEC